MKRIRSFALLALGVVAASALAISAMGWRRAAQTRADWVAARPPLPDFGLATWPEPFRKRVEAADAKLAGPGKLPEVSALAELARLYHANGFLREAEQAYRGLLVFDPQNAHWPHLLATLLAGYGRLDDAIPLLRRAVSLAPDYVPARLHLGDALLKNGKETEADVVYRELLAHFPEQPYALLGLERIDIATSRLTAAREELTRAVRADPPTTSEAASRGAAPARS